MATYLADQVADIKKRMEEIAVSERRGVCGACLGEGWIKAMGFCVECNICGNPQKREKPTS